MSVWTLVACLSSSLPTPSPDTFSFPFERVRRNSAHFTLPPPRAGAVLPPHCVAHCGRPRSATEGRYSFLPSPLPLLPLPPPQKGEGNEIEFPRACRVTQRRSAYTNTHSPRNSSSDEIVRKVDQIWGKGRRSICFIPFDLVRSMSHNKFFQFSCHQH